MRRSGWSLVVLLGCAAPDGDGYVGRDVRLDQAPGADDETGPDATGPLACRSGSFRYVAWSDDRDGGPDVYVRASLDHGRSWSDEVRVSADRPDGAEARRPALACDQGRAVLVWEDTRESDVGYGNVRLSATRDGGRTWSTPVRVSDDPEGAWEAADPAVALSGERVHVVWSDGRAGAFDVFHRASDDLGHSFGPELRLDTDPPGTAWSARPQVALAEPQDVYVVWEDTRDDKVDLYLQASTQAGVDGTWREHEARIDHGEAPGASDAFAPVLATGGGPLAIAWHDTRAGDAVEVMVVVAPDPAGEVPFAGPPVLVGTDAPGAAASRFPGLAWAGERLVLAWLDDRHGSTDVLVATSDDLGATWSDEAWLDEGRTSSRARWPLDVDADGDLVAVTWPDLGDTTPDDPREDVWVATSADGGATFVDPWRCDDDGTNKARSAFPRAMVDAGLGLVDVVWEEWRYGNADVYRRPTRAGGPPDAP